MARSAAVAARWWSRQNCGWHVADDQVGEGVDGGGLDAVVGDALADGDFGDAGGVVRGDQVGPVVAGLGGEQRFGAAFAAGGLAGDGEPGDLGFGEPVDAGSAFAGVDGFGDVDQEAGDAADVPGQRGGGLVGFGGGGLEVGGAEPGELADHARVQRPAVGDL